jgi:6-phosphogluconolactonase
MIRSFLVLLGVATIAPADDKLDKLRVYVSTYRADLDLKTGALTGVALAAETGNPSFLAIHPSNRFRYAVGEGGGKERSVSAFAVDPNTGDLKLLNRQSSKGSGPVR